MHEAFLARQDLDERTKLLDRRDAAFVGRAQLDLGRHLLDVVDRSINLLTVDTGDRAHAAIFDRDLALVFLLHRPDVLATGADDQADLVRRDLHRLKARSVRAQRLTRRAQGLQHLTQDVQAAFLRLVEGLREDLAGQTFALDVHLQRRDATTRADDLEVHVATGVFAAEDVRQDRVVLALHDEAHRDTSDRLLDRHTGVHHRQRARTGGRHRRRAVRLHDLGVDPDRVGELLGRRQERLEAPLGQRTVADLAAARREHALGLTDRERRERVVQQEPLARLRHQAIDDLLVIDAAEGDDPEGLGLTAGEQHRAVHARQHPNLDRDRADGVGATAIGARAAEDRLALALLDDATDDLADLLVPSLGLSVVGTTRCRERLGRGLLRRLDGGGAHGLRTQRRRSLAQVLAAGLLDLRDQLLVDHRDVVFHLRLAGHLGELIDHLDDDLDDLVRLGECFEHDALLHFLGAGLDHDDRIRVTGDRQVEAALFALEVGPLRVDDDLVVDVAHAHTTERATVRQRADRQRGEARDRGEDVAVVFAVRCDDLRQHLHIPAEAIGEHRPDRAVDDAAGEDLLGGRATFTLEETPGDDPHGRRLLAVVDRQGEEVHEVRGRRAVGRGEHHRVAVAGQDGAVRQLGDPAGFEGQRAAADLALDDEWPRGIYAASGLGLLTSLLASLLRGLGRSLLGLLCGRLLGGRTAALCLRRACAIGALLGCHRVSFSCFYRWIQTAPNAHRNAPTWGTRFRLRSR